MQLIRAQQGSQEWLDQRKNYFTASEAPAMLGVSKYKSRTKLLNEKATGITEEIDEQTQARFDEGHRTEEAARTILESELGFDLYPVTAVSDCDTYLMSFDGLSLDDKIGFEHKAWNNTLAAEMDETGTVPACHQPQLDQGFIVNEKLEKFIFVLSDGTADKRKVIEYTREDANTKRIIDGWAQFAEDLKNHEPKVVAEAPEAEHVESLPVIRYELNGLALKSNLDEYRAAAERLLEDSRKELATDQDFANAESIVKACKTGEDELKNVVDRLLSETGDIDTFVRDVKGIGENIRAARLNLEKQVKNRKEQIRTDIVKAAKAEISNHLGSVNATLQGVNVPAPLVNVADAIKGKKNIKSLHEAADDAVASAKLEINQVADQYRTNLMILDKQAPDHRFLFNDIQQIVGKQPDDFELLVKSRVAEHTAAEEKRLEAERERIAAEERAKAEREAAEKAAPVTQVKSEEPAEYKNVAQMKKTAQQPAGRPSDSEIIETISLKYQVHESKVIEWLLDMDLQTASKQLAEKM